MRLKQGQCVDIPNTDEAPSWTRPRTRPSISRVGVQVTESRRSSKWLDRVALSSSRLTADDPASEPCRRRSSKCATWSAWARRRNQRARPTLRFSTRAGFEKVGTVYIQYVGVQNSLSFRTYSFHVVDHPRESREFTVQVPAADFSPGRLKFQDGPEISSERLHRELKVEQRSWRNRICTSRAGCHFWTITILSQARGPK
jgi:hypothetical protein